MESRICLRAGRVCQAAAWKVFARKIRRDLVNNLVHTGRLHSILVRDLQGET